MLLIEMFRTVTDAAATSISSVDLRSGGSQSLQLILGNVAGSALPVNPPTWTWNVPSNIPTDSACKFFFFKRKKKKRPCNNFIFNSFF
jgi:hypothetical protein